MSCHDNCDFSSFSDEPCHQSRFSANKSLLDFSTLSKEEQKILLWRARGSEAETICIHHQKYYGNHFEHLQKNCCDVFKIHKKGSIGLSAFQFVVALNV